MSIRSFLLTLVVTLSFVSCKESGDYTKNTDGSLTWISIDQVSTIKNVEDKMFFVDLYTSWCGWCKRMDKTTFVDADVVKYLDDNFHSVKFDAEQKEEVNFNDKVYKWKPGGRKGVNELAVELLDGRLSYPSFVVLNKDFQVIKKIVGYKKPDQLLEILKSI